MDDASNARKARHHADSRPALRIGAHAIYLTAPHHAQAWTQVQTRPLNFSQFVGGRSGQNARQTLLLWLCVQWLGLRPHARSSLTVKSLTACTTTGPCRLTHAIIAGRSLS